MSAGAAQCWAVILAGGSGRRLGHARPKAFVPVAGEPLIFWSLLAFAGHPDVTDLLPVVPAGKEEEFDRDVLPRVAQRIERRGAKSNCRIHGAVAGGVQRQDSARRSLEAIRAANPSAERLLVLLHDAARPIVPAGLIRAVVTELRKSAHLERPVAVIPVVPAGDTLKRLGGQSRTVEATIPREGIWRVQTPQGFPFEAIERAHREAADCGERLTDDALLFEQRGWPVHTVPGSSLCMKVAYPEDLALIEAYLGGGGR